MTTESKYQVDDSSWPRWVKWLALSAVLASVGHVVAYCYAWRLHGMPMRIEGIYLRQLLRKWVETGRPWPAQTTKYISNTSSDRFFVHTNIYRIGKNRLDSVFAVKSEILNERGFPVISRDGRLVWIDKKSGPELVKP